MDLWRTQGTSGPREPQDPGNLRTQGTSGPREPQDPSKPWGFGRRTLKTNILKYTARVASKRHVCCFKINWSLAQGALGPWPPNSRETRAAFDLCTMAQGTRTRKFWLVIGPECRQPIGGENFWLWFLLVHKSNTALVLRGSCTSKCVKVP